MTWENLWMNSSNHDDDRLTLSGGSFDKGGPTARGHHGTNRRNASFIGVHHHHHTGHSIISTVRQKWNHSTGTIFRSQKNKKGGVKLDVCKKSSRGGKRYFPAF